MDATLVGHRYEEETCRGMSCEGGVGVEITVIDQHQHQLVTRVTSGNFRLFLALRIDKLGHFTGPVGGSWAVETRLRRGSSGGKKRLLG